MAANTTLPDQATGQGQSALSTAPRKLPHVASPAPLGTSSRSRSPRHRSNSPKRSRSPRRRRGRSLRHRDGNDRCHNRDHSGGSQLRERSLSPTAVRDTDYYSNEHDSSESDYSDNEFQYDYNETNERDHDAHGSQPVDVSAAKNLEKENGSDNDSVTNEFINQLYGEGPRDQHLGPPISALLADTINKWATQIPSKEQNKQAFELCKIPQNIHSLGPVRINDIIYNRLAYKAKQNDRKMRNSASYLKRVMGPLSFLRDSLIKAQAYNIKNKMNPPALKTTDGIISLKELTTAVSSAVRLLCMSNAFNLQLRKNSLRPQLDPKYHTLTNQSNRSTSQLFGDDLENKISSIYKVSQAARNPRFNAMKNRQPCRSVASVTSYPGHTFKTIRYKHATSSRNTQFRPYRRSNYGQRFHTGFSAAAFANRGSQCFIKSTGGRGRCAGIQRN